MEPVNEQQLAEALRRLAASRNDEDAWRILFAASWATALSAAHRSLRGQIDLASDVAQEAFRRIVLYCNFSEFREAKSFLAYLRAICLNSARDVLRKLTPELESRDNMDVFPSRRGSPGTPEEAVLADQLQDDLLSQLDELDRQLVGLLVEGYTLNEIASALGMSYSNAGVRLHRLRKSLGKYMKIKDV
jgi:RNA polymerase sigma factor (sigma-70 family)